MGTKAALTPEKLTANLQHLVASSLGVGLDEITESANFTDDLGGDSLDFIEIIMDVEAAYDIEIPDDDAYKLTTFGKLRQYVANHVA